MAVLALSLLTCGGNAATEAAAAATKTEGNDPVATAQQQVDNLQADHKREVYDANTLKAMLPESLEGLPRTTHKGNKVAMGGFNMATAEATYAADSKRIRVTIADGMGMQTTGIGHAAGIDFEQDDGNRKAYTTTLDGHKAFVEFNTAEKQGELNVVYDQSTLSIDARGIDSEAELTQIFKALNIKL